MRFPRQLFNSILFLLVLSVVFGATAVWAQMPPRPQRPERSPRSLDEVSPRALAAGSTSSAATIYVETFGTDSTRCGIQRLPCRTINYALSRAQQLQSTGSVQEVTIQVGPGTYTEGVYITSAGVRLQGAGAGASFITNPDGSAVVLEAAERILITGFTISANWTAVAAWSGASVDVADCELRDSRQGLNVQNNSVASVYRTTFSNNLNGAGVCHQSTMHLREVQITGKSASEGTGFGLCDGAVGSIQYSHISQTRTGISLCCNSEVYNFWDLQISDTRWGIFALENSLLELGGLTINNSSDAGIFLLSSSVAVLIGPTLSNNPTGIYAHGNSYLEMGGGEVNNNGTGIFFDVFAHGLLSGVSYSGNGTDVGTDRGGAYFTE